MIAIRPKIETPFTFASIYYIYYTLGEIYVYVVFINHNVFYLHETTIVNKHASL